MSLTVANSRKSIKISSKFPGIKINKYSKKEKMEKEENPKNTSKGDKKTTSLILRLATLIRGDNHRPVVVIE